MPDNHPQPRGGRLHGYFILPFGDRPVLSVFRDGDGNFFTGNPLLRGPFDGLQDVFRAASLLFRDRTQTPVATQDGSLNRPRGPRPDSSRYGPRTRARRARRVPSPVLTEDLQPPPLPSEKFVAGAADSASALSLQEPDVLSSAELLNTPSSEELITSSPQTVPHNTAEATPPSGHCYSASSGPTIWVRSPPGWYFTFFIRMDRGGCFHMYPDLGGPFQSLKEAEDDIDRYIDKLRRQSMERCNEQDEVPFVERLIRRCVFYPDGTPKRGPNSPAMKNPNYRECHLVQAILDQYNDDHNLFGDLAHELKGDLNFQWISEDTRCYYHFNFTTKTKEAGDNCVAGNLFFAEVSQMKRESDWVVSCCCMIKPNDDGHCYGCFRGESFDIKHPNTDAYAGGHVDEYMAFGGDPLSDSDDDEEAQVAKLRIKFKGRDRAFNREKTKCWNEATAVKN